MEPTERATLPRSSVGHVQKLLLRITKFRFLPESTLLKLADAMGLETKKDITRKGLVDAIKGALRDVSPTS